MNALNSLGLVVSIVALLRLGFVARAGQALVLAQAIGSVVLLTTGLVDNLSLFMFLVFMWGFVVALPCRCRVRSCSNSRRLTNVPES
ncbi:MAG: hypothetical protein CM15mP120_01800 [Pseudomonadota bacterium]|nr:MAG: hypothetical protein CM15mP120_01800 [Pseudomonadota bacterium]